MALWDNEHVAFAQRVTVIADVRQIILEKRLFGTAELANGPTLMQRHRNDGTARQHALVMHLRPKGRKIFQWTLVSYPSAPCRRLSNAPMPRRAQGRSTSPPHCSRLQN